MPLPPFELPSDGTSTAAIRVARYSTRFRTAHTRAVANGDGAFFWPNEWASKPLNVDSGVTRPSSATL